MAKPRSRTAEATLVATTIVYPMGWQSKCILKQLQSKLSVEVPARADEMNRSMSPLESVAVVRGPSRSFPVRPFQQGGCPTDRKELNVDF